MANENPAPEEEIIEFEHQTDPRIKATISFFIGLVGTIIIAWLLGVPLGLAMETINQTIFYHLIPFLISIIFFGILVYKAYIQKIKGLQFLASAILLHGLAEFLFVLSDPESLANTSIFQRNGNFLANLGDLLFPIAVVMIYFHIEYSEKIRPSLPHAIGILGTAIPMVVGELLILIFSPLNLQILNVSIDAVLEEIQKVVFVYLGLFSLVILWISIFAFQVMYGTLKHADSPEIARSSQLVLIAFSSILTNFVLLGVNYSGTLTENPILFGGETIIIHNTWLVTFALVALIMAYILSPSFAYAVPFDVYQLIVINQIQGITLYSFVNEFRSEGKITHDALKSPAIVAIQNLVQEIAQAEGHIILIGMSDRIIVMKNYNEIVSVLITQENSYFLNKGLEDFTEAFYREYEDSIVNFRGNVDVFKSANILVNKHMPFMRKDSLIE